MSILSTANTTISTANRQMPKVEIGRAASETETPSFLSELWDTVNPLQHIPIISSIYRSFTNETISPSANIIGSAVFGGPIGGAIALGSELFKAVTADGGTDTAFAASTQVDMYKMTQANNAYGKMRSSTADWLNSDFNNQKTGIIA